MAYGLECWDSSGRKTVQTSDRLGRYHTTISGNIGANSTGTSTAFIPVTGYNPSDGNWFFNYVADNDKFAAIPVSDGINIYNVIESVVGTPINYTLYIWRA
jgi:hypothetical protein